MQENGTKRKKNNAYEKKKKRDRESKSDYLGLPPK